MASAGLIPGVITCALSGSIGAFGLYLLSLCATRAKHRHSSFHAISKLTFPRAAVFFDAAIATKCFGVSIRCDISSYGEPAKPETPYFTDQLCSSFQLSDHHQRTYAKRGCFTLS